MQGKTERLAEYDETVKEQVLGLARQAYENVRNCWNGEECFSCALVHQFCENLVHLHCKEVTELLRRKIDEHFSNSKTSQGGCISNQFCYNFDALQWKNNQQAAVLNMLENVLTTMIESRCRSEKEKEEMLLEIEYEVNCECHKCRQGGVKSDHVIEGAKEGDYSSLKQITECVRYGRGRKSPEKMKLERIFELLKEERKQQALAREGRKHKNESIFGLFGHLLGLDREKYMDDSCFEQLQKKKAKIYDQLLKKNFMNERYIRKFSRKVNLQKSQAKIMRRGSIDDSLSTTDCASSKAIDSKSLNSSHLSTPPLSSRLLYRTSTIKEPKRSEKELAPIPSIQQAIRHYSKMQESVEKALKSFQPQEKRTSILKSIVFNVTDVFLTERKPFVRPNVDRPYFNRFERVLKSTREVSKFTFRRSIEESKQKVPAI